MISMIVGLFLWKHKCSKVILRPIINLLTLPFNSLLNKSFTGRDRRYQALEQQLLILQDSLDKAPIGYLLLDEENQLLWCNEQARKLLSIDDRWQPGTTRFLLELVRSYELDRLVEETHRTKINQTREWNFYPSNYNLTAKNTLNSKTAIPLKGFAVPLDSDRVAVFLENRQSFVELSQSRDRAFSDLAHEFRTPLTAISLVAETLQKRLKDPESKWLERVLTEIDRLMHLIQDWLEITQIQENPLQNLNYDALDLPELIFSVWMTLKPIAKQKEVKLASLGLDKLEIQGDRARLTQVFLNILDNAIKHSPERGTIEIEIRRISREIDERADSSDSLEYVQIDIIDSGPGFSKLDLPHVFDRLYRGDPSRVRENSSTTPQPQDSQSTKCDRTSGSGLGLALVREIVKAHCGLIEARNHPKTGGAWLQVLLPIDKFERDPTIEK